MEVGCQQEGGWVMGSYKRTSVHWQKVKVSEVAGRDICFFPAVMWAAFHHWWGEKSDVSGVLPHCLRLRGPMSPFWKSSSLP